MIILMLRERDVFTGAMALLDVFLLYKVKRRCRMVGLPPFTSLLLLYHFSRGGCRL